MLVLIFFKSLDLHGEYKVTDLDVVERIAENSSINIIAFYRAGGSIDFRVTFYSEDKKDLEIIDVLASIHSSDFSIGRIDGGPDSLVEDSRIMSSYYFKLPVDLVLRTKLSIDLIRGPDPFSEKNDSFVIYLGETIDWKKIVELSIEDVDRANRSPVEGAEVESVRP